MLGTTTKTIASHSHHGGIVLLSHVYFQNSRFLFQPEDYASIW